MSKKLTYCQQFLQKLHLYLVFAKVYMMAHERLYQNLFDLIDEGIGAAVARDNAPLEAYMRGTRALALLDLGRTREAITEAEFVVFGPYPRGTSSFTARLALARARIRTGIPEEGVLDEARSLPTSTRSPTGARRSCVSPPSASR